ncbi:hypothetical protein E4U30_003249 [Claviceps sp. LM220 group G6]|nr:hypothetical protein E4U30_003249 [Claviceps sp. LM220 group G6]
MSDTQNLNAKTNIIVYLAAGSLQGTSIIGELNDQNLEYEVRYIDLTKNEHNEPWFLEISPIGIIPAITETVRGDDVAIFGTAAILRYLDDEFGRRDPEWYSLKPDISNTGDRWKALNWTCWILHRATILQAVAHSVREHTPNITPYAVEFFKCQILAYYRCLDEHFLGTGYGFIGGDEPTIADFAAVEWISSHALLDIPLEDFSTVDSYYEDADSRIVMNGDPQVPRPLPTLVLF